MGVMENYIVISDGSDSEISTGIGLWSRKRKALGGLSGYHQSTPKRRKEEIIDLTENGCKSKLDNEIIDLTEDNTHTLPYFNISTSDLKGHSITQLGFAETLASLDKSHLSYFKSSKTDEDFFSANASIPSSRTSVNSDVSSLESIKEEEFLHRHKDEYCKHNIKPRKYFDISLGLPRLDSITNALDKIHKSLCSAEDASHTSMQSNSNSTLVPVSETKNIKIECKDEPVTPLSTFNKASMYKLRCYKNRPVHHMFFHKPKPSKEATMSSQVIPSRCMNCVKNTAAENCPEGTLYFLNEFVSIYHYPPRSFLRQFISNFLLGAEKPVTGNEAYSFLLKVQRFHPANLKTVSWDWALLSDVMENKQGQSTFLLFLQYVVQTLEDDFQHNLKQRSLHNSICRSMLSCDKSFCNIRDVIKWLIKSVNNCSEINLEPDQQRVICLLQRMLSIAVEVDKSPSLNSSRIAEFIFPYVICLATSHRRKLLFSSIESILLRAKVIEVIIQHSCLEPTDLPMSSAKIFHFIDHSTLLLEDQGIDFGKSEL
ncbi:hypothetical protein GDO86_005515 [Hymenochirus boettgeri]|uniref:Uncharacterized protein n=1 Tax=Hymenochirus boettgeri TaxID=247094 RepID=A0A8T2J7F4_9PIPI|nr:hypothetical protein GDO86_005515 [Hymenochirus boettgeri]